MSGAWMTLSCGPGSTQAGEEGPTRSDLPSAGAGSVHWGGMLSHIGEPEESQTARRR